MVTKKDIIRCVLTKSEVISCIAKAMQNCFIDNLRFRHPNIQFDCKLRGYIGEHALKKWFNEHGVEIEATDYMPDGDVIDIDFKIKGKNVELKTSLLPDADENIETVINKRDIKIIKRTASIEELKGDVHMQVYFSLKTKERDNWLKQKTINLDNKDKEYLFNSLDGGIFLTATFFVAWIDKPALVTYINSLPLQQRCWSFKGSQREFWTCPLRLSKKPIELIEYFKSFDIPQRIIPLYYSVREDEQYSKYLPFYEVKVACGAFIEGGIPEELGWIDVETEGIRPNNNRFVVKASGDSMLPKIKSGDLCVFERNWAGSRNGQIVLAQSREFDPDYTGKYTIKKYQSVTNQTSEWDMQKSVDLIPLNQDYEVIHLSEDDDVQIIGVLIGVIQGGEFKELEEPEEPHIGYCIRCGKAIDYSFHNEKPILYCKECWRSWRSNGSNPNAPERYCHRCGKSGKPKYKDAISYNYPICADCWKDR